MTTGPANTFEGWPGWAVFASCDNCGTDEYVDYEGDYPRDWGDTEAYGLTCDGCMENISHCERCDREVDTYYDSIYICYDEIFCDDCAGEVHEESFEEEDPDDRPKLDQYGCCTDCGYDCSEFVALAEHGPAETKPIDAWLP